jgi:CheY-like chemotaxis protein
MRVEAVDVGALVTGLADQLRRTWGDSIAVESSIEPEVGSLQTDPGQLEAALVDLCLNARDAIAAGGRLRLEVRKVPRDEGRPDSISALAPGDYVAVEVRDDGVGMAPDVLERAFDPFFTTKELGHGAGLGLSVVHGFARRARGAVDLQSETGKGTCATLYLPRTLEEHRDADARPEAGGARSLRPATVLVVEDDEDIREFAASVLRDAGYQVCEAADGRSAVEILRHRPPFDLLLTDVMMPGGITGQEVAEEAQAGGRPVPVVYASGHAPDALLRDGRLRGHESFLAKPYSADELVRSVQDACGRRGSSTIRCTRR